MLIECLAWPLALRYRPSPHAGKLTLAWSLASAPRPPSKHYLAWALAAEGNCATSTVAVERAVDRGNARQHSSIPLPAHHLGSHGLEELFNEKALRSSAFIVSSNTYSPQHNSCAYTVRARRQATYEVIAAGAPSIHGHRGQLTDTSNHRISLSVAATSANPKATKLARGPSPLLGH